ncbi:serine hydrolase domain-containing protein [Lysobacter silvisoli]|nr:serine hydrolase domain-containing protein [Lysobacter silvisoli]
MRLWILSFALAAASLPSVAAPAPSAAAVARYAQRQLQTNYAQHGPGAALLVARGDQVLYRGALGEASVELGVPLSAERVFRIGSVTKQFAAAGLLKLVEAGKVGLDDPLSKYLPDYPNGAKITVRQLLNHTSGVKSYTGIPGVMAGPIRMDLSTAQLIDTFEHLPVDFAPGEKWAYNNSGYVLVGAVIEAASGQPWHEYLQQALFQPLGLQHTRWGDDHALIPGQVQGYTLSHGAPAPANYASMSQPHAAGALVSTVDDLLRWNRALHEGKVLRSDLYTAMITPEGAAKAEHYGYGIEHAGFRNGDALAHSGGIFGFLSFLIYVPGSDVSVAIVQNSDLVARGKRNPEVLARKIAAYAIGQPYPEPVAARPIEPQLKPLEGVYRMDANTARAMRVVGGRLVSQRIGGQRVPLEALGNDEFLFEDGLSRLRFERDAQGRATGVRFYPDGEGEGIYSRRTDEALPIETAAIALPAAARERVVGRYAREGRVLSVFQQGEQLMAQMTGQPPFALAATSPHRYTVDAVGAVLEFAPESGPAQTLTLRQGGAVLEFKREP